MQHDNKTFIPALQYAARHDLSIDNVIKMIKDGSLSGRSEEVPTDYGIETRWFVEVESSETEGVEYRIDRIHEEVGNQQRTAGGKRLRQARCPPSPAITHHRHSINNFRGDHRNSSTYYIHATYIILVCSIKSRINFWRVRNRCRYNAFLLRSWCIMLRYCQGC